MKLDLYSMEGKKITNKYIYYNMPDIIQYYCDHFKYYKKYKECECQYLNIDENNMVCKYKKIVEFDGKYHKWNAVIYTNECHAFQFIKFYNSWVIQSNNSDIVTLGAVDIANYFGGAIVFTCKNCNLTMPIDIEVDDKFNLKFIENNNLWMDTSYLDDEYNHLIGKENIPCNEVLINNILE